MDHESQKQLEHLLAQTPGSLSEHDRTFLRARESYLTPEQRERFAECFVMAKDEPVQASEEASKPAKKK